MSEVVDLTDERLERKRGQLRILADKALFDSSTLSLKDLDEICTLVANLGPSGYMSPKQDAPSWRISPRFEPLVPPIGYPVKAKARLRQAHAWEYVAARLADLLKLADWHAKES